MATIALPKTAAPRARAGAPVKRANDNQRTETLARFAFVLMMPAVLIAMVFVILALTPA